jgi:hypothetical protein
MTNIESTIDIVSKLATLGFHVAAGVVANPRRREFTTGQEIQIKLPFYLRP